VLAQLRYGQAEAEAGRLPQKISARARSAVQERAPAACEESGKRLQMFMNFCEHQKHTQKVKVVFKVVIFEIDKGQATRVRGKTGAFHFKRCEKGKRSFCQDRLGMSHKKR